MATNDRRSSPQRINAIGTATEIVECLTENGPMGVSELATALDMPKSTVHVYLRTLCENGFAVQEETRYRTGLAFLRHGGRARKQLEVYRAAKDEIDNLADETGEAANLGVEQGGQRVLIYKSEREGSIFDNAPTGEFTCMHWTAIGKAILSHLSSDRVEEILDRHGLPRATDHTITGREAMFDELQRTRRRGFAVEDEERREGVVAIAAPIRDTAADVAVGALSISGPRDRLKPDGLNEDLVDAVRHRANVAELRYNHY